MTREELCDALHQLAESGRIRKEELDAVDEEKIWKFVESPLAKRMANGTVKKEQPFVMGRPAKDVLPDATSEEMVLIQGIIDAYFEEKDGLVIVDYKTDKVPYPGGDVYLKEKYHRQLELYAEALSSITGKPVKATYIYSVRMGRTIKVTGV